MPIKLSLVFVVQQLFIYLMILICDGPSLSVTRVCADDFGSALKSLKTLGHQTPILDLAAKCAGLILKPAKCVLILTVLRLSPLLIQSIRDWLTINVLQFANIVISESGKFLGWHLGRHSATLSFAAPIKKFVHRVQEVCLGKAPAVEALFRYNQRVVLVCHTFHSLLFLLILINFSPLPIDLCIQFCVFLLIVFLGSLPIQLVSVLV